MPRVHVHGDDKLEEDTADALGRRSLGARTSLDRLEIRDERSNPSMSGGRASTCFFTVPSLEVAPRLPGHGTNPGRHQEEAGGFPSPTSEKQASEASE